MMIAKYQWKLQDTSQQISPPCHYFKLLFVDWHKNVFLAKQVNLIGPFLYASVCIWTSPSAGVTACRLLY